MTIWLIVSIVALLLCAALVARAYRLPPANTCVFLSTDWCESVDHDDYDAGETRPNPDRAIDAECD